MTRVNTEPEAWTLVTRIRDEARSGLRFESKTAAVAEVKKILDERDAAIARAETAASMFELTRRRVLQRMGEPDPGKSWCWIEAEVAALKERIATMERDHDDAMGAAMMGDDW